MENRFNSVSDKTHSSLLEGTYKPWQPCLEKMKKAYQPVNLANCEKMCFVEFFELRTNGHKEEWVYLFPDVSFYVLFLIKEEDVELKLHKGIFSLEKCLFQSAEQVFVLRIPPETIPTFETISRWNEWICSLKKVNQSCYFKKVQMPQFYQLSFYRKIENIIHNHLSNFKFASQGDSIMSETIKRLYLAKGNVSIEKLASDMGYVERYIRKLYHLYFGFSPKAFARILRIQHVFSILLDTPFMQSIDIALNCGYSDGAHLNREMKQFLHMNLSDLREGWQKHVE